jgi:hypothetical protein
VRTFLFQEIDRPCAGGGVDAHVGRGVQPVTALGVEILQRAKAASGQEVVFHIADHAFDLSLGVDCELHPMGGI